MKVSYKWLQEYIDEPLPTVEKLVDELTMHSFEVEGTENVGDDKILDIKVLPNRTHDCLSHYGIASEICSVCSFNRAWLLPSQKLPKSDKIKVSLSSKTAKRALMVYIENVNIKSSPEWLQDKLKIFGYKPINNLVDITNYLTLAYGEPMHIFDADKIENRGGIYNIDIRDAKKDEKITLLNGTEYTLPEFVTVISDSKKALDVAGIMGGKESSVSSSTKNIILSLSSFDAVSIRKTAKFLNIRTDASVRFENDISASLVDRALPYALKLISELGGGEVIDSEDIYPIPQKQTIIDVTSEKINKILGITLDKLLITSLLEKQQIKADKTENGFTISVPLERLDLTISEDIIEEIGRLHGYSKVPMEELPKNDEIEINKENNLSIFIRDLLCKNGFSEIYTYAFQDTGEVEIENPLAKDKRFLRSNLGSGMEYSLAFNFKYLDLIGMDRVKLFEIGKVFKASGEYLHLSIGIKYSKKGEVDLDVAKTIDLIEKTFGISIGDVSVGGGVAEVDLGKLIEETKIPMEKNKIEIEKKEVLYKSISPYPFAVRDVAVFVPTGTDVEKVENLIKKHLTDIVVRLSVFDTFSKGDKISYAFRLVFQSENKTLTDVEINAVMDPIYANLKAEPGYEIR